jgi:hypothetical protein
MIVGNRERENAPTTFTISKAVETVGGADAAVLQSLLNALAVKPNATVEDVAWQFAETSGGVDEGLAALNAELAKLKTDNAKMQTDLATVKTAPVPVGTVVSSLIPVAQFQALYGTFSANATWILANGSDVTGSEYAKVMGRNTVPDLRGAYLRMAGTNAAQTGWAGGNINTYAEDSTRAPRTTNFSVEHRDPMRYGDSGRGIAGAAYGAGEAYLRPGLNTVTVTGGDPETRPKTYHVNYYIKIN